MTNQLVPLFVLVLMTFPAIAADQPGNADSGPLAVETIDSFVLKDAARKKELVCKAHVPATGGPYPVILFSHGFGGNKDAFGPVAKHWAGHGYVVIHPSHDDGVGRDADGRARDGGAPRRRFPAVGGGGGGRLLGALNDPQKISDRIADLTHVLDSLEDLPKVVPALAGKMDVTKVGVGGHSFGAYTAMLLGGVTADLGGVEDKSFLDQRVACILPISAQGTGQQGLTEDSWTNLRLPMMTVTGTLDRGARGQGVEWKKEPFKYSPPGNKYLVVIDGAHHVSFGGNLGARGARVTDSVNLVTTCFWDAYLKKSAAAMARLQAGRLSEEADGKFTFERK